MQVGKACIEFYLSLLSIVFTLLEICIELKFSTHYFVFIEAPSSLQLLYCTYKQMENILLFLSYCCNSLWTLRSISVTTCSFF